MDQENKINQQIASYQQEQMLKLVTQSFYRELVNYGVDTNDIIKVTNNLLDKIFDEDTNLDESKTYYNKVFKIKDISDEWQFHEKLKVNDISIIPLTEIHLDKISEWLNNPVIDVNFIQILPKKTQELKNYFFNREDRLYFGIYYQDEIFIGIIGADNIDSLSRKLEMKKFIGETDYRGKGYGKKATFLFLYHSFMIRNFNKVYIHSFDTNIRNINLNSKFGFDLEGISFRDIRFENKYLDVVKMGLLQNKWLKIFNSSTSIIE